MEKKIYIGELKIMDDIDMKINSLGKIIYKEIPKYHNLLSNPEDLPPIGTTCLAKLHTIGVNGVGWEHAEDLYEYQVLTYFNGFWGHKPLYGPINILRYKEVIAWIELPETEIIK